MTGGKKSGSSSLDKNNKQKAVVPILGPISRASEYLSNVFKFCSIDPIKETVNCKESLLDESTSSSTSRAVEVVRESLKVSKFNKSSEIVKKDGKYTLSIQVDSPLIRFVKGKWGSTQKQIEKEMGVKLIFPAAKGGTSIVIEGASIENVTKALEKIANVLEQAVESPNLDYSHFVSLPLAFNPELVEKLQNFQNSVLREDNFSANCDMEGSIGDRDEYLKVLGIDRSIFIGPKTFHLTVLMLKLWNKDRVAMATEILKGVSSKVMDALESRPVSIRLRGLACMRGSPAKAHVLYAPVEEVGGEGRLLRACQVIIDAYIEAGLVMPKDAGHTLKLHATLMNVRHRNRKKWAGANNSFDARGIFKIYGSKYWGEYLIPEAHLSERFAYDESGYYHCCGSIALPGSMKIK